MTSLIVHHSVMAEMLPCTLSLSRYNPTFRQLDESNDSEGQDGDSDIDGDYLDPSKDSDYELISKLRHGLTKGHNFEEDEENYSELQELDYESGSNNKLIGVSIPLENTHQKKSPAGGNHNSIVTEKNPQSSRATSSTNVRKEQYR